MSGQGTVRSGSGKAGKARQVPDEHGKLQCGKAGVDCSGSEQYGLFRQVRRGEVRNGGVWQARKGRDRCDLAR